MRMKSFIGVMALPLLLLRDWLSESRKNKAGSILGAQFVNVSSLESFDTGT
jgi:hypothetical protein